MAIANFYTFSKRKNSTKQPTGSGTQLDLNLKSGTSLLSPTFLLSLSSRPDYNYIWFEGRYYFVKDIISVRDNLWEIQAEVDPLASWKNTIGAAEAIILHATGGRNDIVDPRIPIDDSVAIHSNTVAINGWSINNITYGSIMLSVVGIGSFGTYMLTNNSDLFEMMQDSTNWWDNIANIGSVEDALKQFFYGGSAGDSLKNCIALPINLTYASPDPYLGPAEQLYLGPYPAQDSSQNPIMVHRINNPIYKSTTTVTIPWQYSDWRRHKPYTEVQLYLPFIGTVMLDANELVNASALDIDYSLNIASGDLAVSVATDSPIKAIMTASNNIAMSLPFGSANIPSTKSMAAAVTAIAAMAATAYLGGKGDVSGAALGVKVAGTGAASAAAVLLGSGSQSGGGGLSGGASQGLLDRIMCTTISKSLTDSQANFDSIMGKPVFEKDTIGNYSGYVQTDGLSIAGAMTDTEREAINAAFNGGAYYE
jgi:hypothetical protein